ncbi:hypothetical protein [Sorangium sp. So ce204]|uniref:hypothetical protein n=1 Tax=Sorangium sp. So ce204 TaxID=3133288 RepID=UPI003F6438D9
MDMDESEKTLALLVERGFPAPIAKMLVMAVPKRWLRKIRSSPVMLSALARDLFDNEGTEFLLPAQIVARHADGTFDLEFDIHSEYARVLRKNHQSLADMLGIEYKEGVRFCNVPGVEGFPIPKSDTRASIGFKAADVGRPYAKPALVIIGGNIPEDALRSESVDPKAPVDQN